MIASVSDGGKLSVIPTGADGPRLRGCALHPSEDWLVAAGHGELHIVNAQTGTVQNTVCTYRGMIHSLSTLAAKMTELTGSGLTPQRMQTEMMQTANAEAFATLTFSGDGKWLCTGSTLGLRVYRWEDLLALDSEAVAEPVYKVNAQPGALSHFTYCYTTVVDEVAGRVLFAGLQGIVESLNLATGSVCTLLTLPELLGITRIELSSNRKFLAVEAKKFERNTPRPTELTIWNYETLVRDASARHISFGGTETVGRNP